MRFYLFLWLHLFLPRCLCLCLLSRLSRLRGNGFPRPHHTKSCTAFMTMMTASVSAFDGDAAVFVSISFSVSVSFSDSDAILGAFLAVLRSVHWFQIFLCFFLWFAGLQHLSRAYIFTVLPVLCSILSQTNVANVARRTRCANFSTSLHDCNFYAKQFYLFCFVLFSLYFALLCSKSSALRCFILFAVECFTLQQSWLSQRLAKLEYFSYLTIGSNRGFRE